MALSSALDAAASSSPTVEDLLPLSQASLERFDAAMPPGAAIPNALLHETPGRDLAGGLQRFVATLKAIDLAAVSKPPSWWARLTGADLEDRIILQRAIDTLSADLNQALAAAARTQAAARTMAEVGRALRGEQAALEALIGAGQGALDRTADKASESFARLQRKVANATALHTANTLTIAQLKLTLGHVRGLLDRAAEVKTLLFPVWRRHAMALASGCAPLERKGASEALRGAHQQMTTTLSQTTEAETP